MQGQRARSYPAALLREFRLRADASTLRRDTQSTAPNSPSASSGTDRWSHSLDVEPRITVTLELQALILGSHFLPPTKALHSLARHRSRSSNFPGCDPASGPRSGGSTAPFLQSNSTRTRRTGTLCQEYGWDTSHVGSKGIKRRKPYRRLPSVRGDSAISDSDQPPIMWPSPGSGFEADPFSAAGTSQREWFLIRRLGQSLAGKVVTWVVLAAVVIPLVWVAVSSVLGH